MRIMLTPEIAHAAGRDAGNRSMRDGNRTVWSVDDYNVACVETNRLLDIIDRQEISAKEIKN